MGFFEGGNMFRGGGKTLLVLSTVMIRLEYQTVRFIITSVPVPVPVMCYFKSPE